MPDLFQDTDADAFSLPGDDEKLAAAAPVQGSEAETPAPGPETEPETAAEEAETETVEAEPEGDSDAAEEGLSADDPEVQRYLERFGGDPQKALRAAVEAQQLIGRQGQELGELRRLVEERLPEQQTAPQPQYDQGALEAWFDEHPTRIPEIAAQAYYEGNEQVMNAAIAAWEDVDRAGARAFERRIAVAEARAELHAESTQRDQIAGDWNTAAEAFAEAHPDFDTVAPKMRELAPQFPHMLELLRSGDPAAKREVLEFLYEKARGQHADTLSTTARTIAREQAQEAEEAIKGAAVASATAAVPANEPDTAQRIAAEWDKADAPYNDGWNI